jgi:hypothetical protein
MFCTLTSQSSGWGVSSEWQWSYSGAHWVNGALWQNGHLEIRMAHRLALQQSRFPWDGGQGITLGTRYYPEKMGFISLQYNLNVPNREQVVLHEAFLGFGMRKTFRKRWDIAGNLGLGNYLEQSNGRVRYTKRGITHCTNFGLSYRFL